MYRPRKLCNFVPATHSIAYSVVRVQVVPAALGAALFYALFASAFPEMDADRAFSSASISSSSKRCILVGNGLFTARRHHKARSRRLSPHRVNRREQNGARRGA